MISKLTFTFLFRCNSRTVDLQGTNWNRKESAWFLCLNSKQISLHSCYEVAMKLGKIGSLLITLFFYVYDIFILTILHTKFHAVIFFFAQGPKIEARAKRQAEGNA